MVNRWTCYIAVLIFNKCVHSHFAFLYHTKCALLNKIVYLAERINNKEIKADRNTHGQMSVAEIGLFCIQALTEGLSKQYVDASIVSEKKVYS